MMPVITLLYDATTFLYVVSIAYELTVSVLLTSTSLNTHSVRRTINNMHGNIYDAQEDATGL